jgi:four helix bundle protein
LEHNLDTRLFEFAIRVIKFLKYLPDKPEFRVIRTQLAKASTSSGSNEEEAQAASSKKDFIYKIEIALREMRESNYWLRIIQKTLILKDEDYYNELKYLLNESFELKNILASIVLKTKQNLKTPIK